MYERMEKHNDIYNYAPRAKKAKYLVSSLQKTPPTSNTKIIHVMCFQTVYRACRTKRMCVNIPLVMFRVHGRHSSMHIVILLTGRGAYRVVRRQGCHIF
jgi:hypothetical protein